MEAVEKLARNGSAAAIHELCTFITTLPPGDFREEVVRVASSVENPAAVPAVVELLQSAEDPGVIRMAQEIFARLAGAETIQAMLDRYDESSDAALRDRLERTVACISSEEAVAVLKLVVGAKDTPATDGMVCASVQALRRIGTGAAVDALMGRLDSESSAGGRALIAAQIAEVRNPVAETSLRMAATGDSQFATKLETRITAMGALLNHPSAETQEALAVLAKDSQPEIAASASGILAEIQRRLDQ